MSRAGRFKILTNRIYNRLWKFGKIFHNSDKSASSYLNQPTRLSPKDSFLSLTGLFLLWLIKSVVMLGELWRGRKFIMIKDSHQISLIHFRDFYNSSVMLFLWAFVYDTKSILNSMQIWIQ